MSTNRIEGAAKQALGSVKEGIGKATHNDKLVAEGLADRAAGKAQNTLGKAQDTVANAIKK